MSKNNLAELNNHLFSQLGRLNDPDLKGDKLNEEIERSKAVTSVSTQIVKSAHLTLAANKFVAEHMRPGKALPEVLDDDAITAGD